jgi:hypothetical protein
MSRPALPVLWLVLSIVSALTPACGGDPSAPDAASASAPDAFVSEGVDAAPIDAAITPGDAGPIDGGGVACSPMPGAATGGAYCDLLELAVITQGSSQEARLYGRLSPEGASGCVVVDEVEVLEGGASIGTLGGAGPFVPDSEGAILARGPALPSMVSRCASDEGRFETYGLLVRGRYDGGSFEARCAAAEGGSRWPPALRITCHDNVDAPARWASATVMSFMGFTTTQLMVSLPHGPGGAITDVSGPVHVLPHAGTAFGAPAPPPPFDAVGFMASVSESESPIVGPYSSVSLSANDDVFGPTLCPVASTMPMPGAPPPPVFLARIAGTSARGAFSSEAYVSYCTRPAL